MDVLPPTAVGGCVLKSAPKLLPAFATMVLLSAALTAVTPLSTTSERWYQGHLHRALAGHQTGALFGISMIRCAAECLAQKASCVSFNHDDTSDTCQLNDARMEEFPENFEPSDTFSYFGTRDAEPLNDQTSTTLAGLVTNSPQPVTTPVADPGWQLVFKGVAGAGPKLYELWTTTAWNASTMEAGGGWRDNSLHEAWGNGELNIRRVKLSLCNSTGSTAELIFNGTGSDTQSWFTKDRLISCPWQDLKSTAANYFSIVGHNEEDRRFYINFGFGGCPNDSGWLVVTDSQSKTDCEYERPSDAYPYPTIMYSKAVGWVTWQDVLMDGSVTVGRADYLTIHIDGE